MYRALWIAAITLSLTAAWPAAAEVTAEDMARVRGQLMEGNIDNALRLLQDLQVEAPDSPFVQFGLGEAYALAAEDAAQRGEVPLAMGYLDHARRAFDTAAHADAAPSLKADAHYNTANALTRMGELFVADQQWDGAVQLLLEALETYDTALARDPDHASARHNRAYARWTLKQLLAEEPPPPEQEAQPEGDEEQDDEGEDEEQQEQPPPGEEEDEQPQGEEEQDNEESPGEQEQTPEQTMPPPMPPEEQPGEPQEPEDMPMHEFEALLDNLMDIDEEEQRNLRREPRTQQAIGEWW